MLKILHITGHLGGGVGTVVLNYLVGKSADTSQRHSVISLDYINDYAAGVLSQSRIEHVGRCHGRDELIESKIHESDVVLLHWWNHPLITDLLVRCALPKSRFVLWSHISGSPAPNNFTRKIFEYPDEFIFTTPLSYFDPEFVGLPDHIKSKVGAIWSTAGVERLERYSPVAHDGFNIGYVGNLDFTKIHSEFIEICRSINLPGTRFTVVGPLNERLALQIKEAGLAERVRFTGFVPEDEKWAELCRFDVFGYPLAPHHYGTCDQTLQEAMAVGIVPVVLDNPMESYIVRHGEVGLVARSISDYIACIHSLYADQPLRARLAKSARIYAFSEYSLQRLITSWDEIFSGLMRHEKRKRAWPMDRQAAAIEPHQVFLESLGRHSGVFEEYLRPLRVSRAAAEDQLKALGSRHNWRSENKSTVHQYAQFFPQDEVLRSWSRLMKGGEEHSL